MHIYVHAQRMPDKLALRVAGTDLPVPCSQLKERSNPIAQMLHGVGLQAGDRIAIRMENQPRPWRWAGGLSR
ncbi:MAG TPA: hypothetical protein DCL83_03140 [Arthrobacter bacterium]|nr:hypothetical protein [Arthrobacter sp.]